jgi:hypothetical protein
MAAMRGHYQLQRCLIPNRVTMNRKKPSQGRMTRDPSDG